MRSRRHQPQQVVRAAVRHPRGNRLSTRRVVILGGGLAGLTTAWELSRPGWRDQFAAITVLERSSMPGGKGASGRGVHGRIEEHGLHVWLGYYDNAFRLIREVYGELDRATTDPGCPLQTFDDAFFAAGDIGVGEIDGDGDTSGWTHWVAPFAAEAGGPGGAGRPFTAPEFLTRAVQLLAAFAGSLPSDPAPRRRGVFLSASPRRPGPTGGGPAGAVRRLARQAESAALVASLQGLLLLERAGAGSPGPWRTVLDQLETVRRLIARRLAEIDGGGRVWQVADLVTGCVRGMVEDRVFSEERFAAIDHVDFREWLAGRVSTETLASPLITGLYDLVFAYEDGDRSRPRFSAGLGLFLAGRLFFDYRGSVFWKMRAGMGDAVVAPLYQALRARGVDIDLGHRVEEMVLGADATVTTLRVSRPAASGGDVLRRVAGLPCFPSAATNATGARSETELRAGRDFDVVVLAVPVGVLPTIAPRLVEMSERWRRMVTEVRTVGTQALQVWLGPSETDLGWAHAGATVSGYDLAFDTYASMSHLASVEGWEADGRPGTVGYFCGVLPNDVTAGVDAAAVVERGARRFLTDHAGVFWPAAVDDTGFRWDLVVPDGLYTRANTDPSDRYVQSVPGSGRHRLRADESGVDNLVLAGDWTNCGLNAGCVEAAVMSGIEAANVVTGRPLTAGLAGRWYGLGTGEDARPSGRACEATGGAGA